MTVEPDVADYYLRRARCYEQRRNSESASADYDRAVALAPEDPAALLARARSRLESFRYRVGLEDVERALTAAPDSAISWGLRGEACLRLGRIGVHEDVRDDGADAARMGQAGA